MTLTMSDRGLLFIFGVFMIVLSLGAIGFLMATGQAATVDGLFLLLYCGLVALSFVLYLMFMIRRAMQPPEPPAKPVAKPAAAKKAEPVTAE